MLFIIKQDDEVDGTEECVPFCLERESVKKKRRIKQEEEKQQSILTCFFLSLALF